MHRISILCLLGVFSLSVVLAAQGDPCTYNSDGSTPCCDADTGTLKGTSDYCGAADNCNAQSFCTGTSSTCPTNYKSSTTACSAAVGRCYNDGLCDGSGTCRAQTRKTAGSVCVPADTSACKSQRTCSASGVCQAATASGNTVVCHASSVCEKEVKCPAPTSSTPFPACPARQPRGSGTVCRSQDVPNCIAQANCPSATGNAADKFSCPAVSYLNSDVVCHSTACHDVQCNGNPGCTEIRTSTFKDPGEDCTAEAGCTGTQSAECDGNGNCGSCHNPSTGGTADPLISGFHNQRFWLEGDSGKFYNMFSQPGMTLNAKIISARNESYKYLTVMGEIAFVTKNNIVHITPVAGRNGTVTVNGKQVQLSKQANVYDLDDCVQLAWSPKSILLSSASFEIVIAYMLPNHRDHLDVDYLNVKIPHVSGDVEKMSGIIGQTAHETVNIDKNWTDFEVSDIQAYDSAKNTFEKAELTCEKSDSKRSVGKYETATKQETVDMSYFANPKA